MFSINQSKIVITALIISLLFSSKLLLSQTYNEPEEDENIEQQIESTSENADADIDFSDIFESLNYFKLHPLNLNEADAVDLKNLVFLNDIQINNLIEYRRKYGDFLSIYELQAVDGFYLDIIFKILPYVNVSENHNMHRLTLKNISKYSVNKIIFRYKSVLEQQKGYSYIEDSLLKISPNSRYLGTKQKLYLRYNMKYFDRLSFGITAKKDAGEEFFKGSQKNGFDFYSAHLFLKNIGRIKYIALGDFQAGFGQGLTFQSGLSFYGKSSELFDVRKYTQSLRPYTSSDENRFLRGAGLTVEIAKRIELTGFISQKKIDAGTLYFDSLNNKFYTSFSSANNGLHATKSQIDNKHNLQEKIIGGHIAYRSNGLNLGVTAFNLKYDNEVVFVLKPYNQFSFTGNNNSTFGADFSYSVYNMNIFAEASEDGNQSHAYTGGLLLCPSFGIMMSVIYRHFDRDFHPFFSNAFSESSENYNEEGIYSGIKIMPDRKISISAYSDFFKFLWLKYQIDRPSDGSNYLLKIVYNPDKNFEAYFLYRYKNKLQNTDENYILEKLNSNVYNNYRLNMQLSINENVRLRNRIEILNHISPENRRLNGFLVYQDIIYKAHKSPLTFTFRYAIFDTDTYDERIYAYENDVPYSYSVPSYFYKGSRYYLLVHYSLFRNLEFWLRYSQTYYNNKQIIVTGLDEINGNTKSDLSFELRLIF